MVQPTVVRNERSNQLAHTCGGVGSASTAAAPKGSDPGTRMAARSYAFSWDDADGGLMTAAAASGNSLSADEWRQIVDSAVETAIISTDVSGRVTSWNEGARLILGWSAAEMVGQTLERLFPDGLGTSALEREMADAVARGRGGGEEGWRIRKDGSLIWAAGEMTPICDFEKKVVGFTKILRDRSSRREAEQAILEERRALEVNRPGFVGGSGV